MKEVQWCCYWWMHEEGTPEPLTGDCSFPGSQKCLMSVTSHFHLHKRHLSSIWSLSGSLALALDLGLVVGFELVNSLAACSELKGREKSLTQFLQMFGLVILV